MKHLIMTIFAAALLSCAGAASASAPQEGVASDPQAVSAFSSLQAEVDFLWEMMYQKDAIIEALQGELLAYQGSTYDLNHMVLRGESLWTISRDLLGDPFAWITLYSLNQFTIENPNLIYPRQVLLLP